MKKIFTDKKIPDPGKKLLLLLSAMSLVCASLVWYRHLVTGSPMYMFLLWNLFLAWVPYLISSYMRWTDSVQRKWYLNLLAGSVWLLFFPNAPYILTDLVHLKPRPDISYWYDFQILLFFCFNSLFIAFASLIQMKRFIDHFISPFFSHLAMLFILVLTSFGIYLGRFERYNSWDIVMQPFSLIHDCLHIIANAGDNKKVLYTTGLLAIFLTFTYFTLVYLFKDHEHRRTPAQKEK